MIPAPDIPTVGQQRLRQAVYHLIREVPDYFGLDPIRQAEVARNFFRTLSTIPLIATDPLLARRRDSGVSSYYLQWVNHQLHHTQHRPPDTYVLPLERFASLGEAFSGRLPRFTGGALPARTLQFLIQIALGEAPVCDQVTFYPRQYFLTTNAASRDCLLSYTLWGECHVPVWTFCLCTTPLEPAEFPFGRTLLEIQDALAPLAPSMEAIPFHVCAMDSTERRAIRTFGECLPEERAQALAMCRAQYASTQRPLDIEILLRGVEVQRDQVLRAYRQKGWLTTLKYRWEGFWHKITTPSSFDTGLVPSPRK